MAYLDREFVCPICAGRVELIDDEIDDLAFICAICGLHPLVICDFTGKLEKRSDIKDYFREEVEFIRFD